MTEFIKGLVIVLLVTIVSAILGFFAGVMATAWSFEQNADEEDTDEDVEVE